MKTFSIKCETQYTVSITFSEWWEIMKTGEDEQIGDARARFSQFPLFTSNANMMKIANALGFDGWTNAGYINDRTGEYVCVLKNNGCTI